MELIDFFVKLNPNCVVVERLTTYKEKRVDLEKINRFTGMVEYISRHKYLILVKASEWKIKIFKQFGELEFKFGKRNIKTSREFAEKYFSFNFKTEHEADAFLLAYYGYTKLKSIAKQT